MRDLYDLLDRPQHLMSFGRPDPHSRPEAVVTY